ncbi:MAG: hypothetical protein QOC85_963, partial [Streptomyces sp.]|nr:hypothetical protein [Streptomyces sp.]
PVCPAAAPPGPWDAGQSVDFEDEGEDDAALEAVLSLSEEQAVTTSPSTTEAARPMPTRLRLLLPARVPFPLPSPLPVPVRVPVTILSSPVVMALQ